MIPTESEIANQSLLAWDNWLNTAPGLYVLNWEQAQFNRAVDDAFGFDALQIGFPQVGCLNENRISNRWLMQLPSQPTVDLSCNHGVHTICQGSIYDLPFATESMDLIALPHVLEFTANPHEECDSTTENYLIGHFCLKRANLLVIYVSKIGCAYSIMRLTGANLAATASLFKIIAP